MANQNIKLGAWNAVIHLPASYSSSSKKYPTIVFFPGAGEIGTDINLVKKFGPNAYIDAGWNGNVGTVEFIVVSIQPIPAYPRPSDMKPSLDALFTQYRVDTAQVFATGLSRGGRNVHQYALHIPKAGDFSYQKTFKAIATYGGQLADDIYGVELKYPDGFKSVAAQGVKELNVEQKYDKRGGDKVVSVMNTQVPGSATYVETLFGSGGHDNWWNFYGGKVGGTGTVTQPAVLPTINKTVYEWMASQTVVVQPNQPPVVNAGVDKTITLPTNNATFTATASDTDGTIVSYNWSIVNGSCLLTDFNKATVLVTNFIDGDIELKVEVTDNSGAKASDNVKLTVLQDPNAKVLKVSGTISPIGYIDKILNIVGPTVITAQKVQEGDTITLFNSTGSQITYPDGTTSTTRDTFTAITFITNRWIAYGKI